MLWDSHDRFAVSADVWLKGAGVRDIGIPDRMDLIGRVGDLVERKKVVWRHRIKRFLGSRPGLYFPIFRFKSSHRGLLVNSSTDVCIEGFPRSANSFAVGAFEHAQQRPVEIAHHNHVPAQIIRACERSIPTLVLIREPVASVISQRALSLEIQQAENAGARSRDISFRDLLRSWISFYRSIEPYRGNYVIGLFPRVVTNFGRVIGRLNDRFGTSFEVFEHTRMKAKEVNEERGYHAGPSGRRDRIKDRVRGEFDSQSGDLRPLIQEAGDIYSSFEDWASVREEQTVSECPD